MTPPKILLLLASVVLVAAGCRDMGVSPVVTGTIIPPPPPQGATVSFRSQIQPVFSRYGCSGCHGGSGGLFVTSVATLLQGGSHGPVIVPGNADASNIVKKISPNPPFGDRMPQGGPYLPDSTIQLFKDWINQGAKDN